jgi:hypothetical protein
VDRGRQHHQNNQPERERDAHVRPRTGHSFYAASPAACRYQRIRTDRFRAGAANNGRVKQNVNVGRSQMAHNALSHLGARIVLRSEKKHSGGTGFARLGLSAGLAACG